MTSSTEQSLHVPFPPDFHAVPTVIVPFDVLDITANTLMRSRHSLMVLSQLLKRGSLDDLEVCLSSMLDVLIENMEMADQMIEPFAREKAGGA